MLRHVLYQRFYDCMEQKGHILACKRYFSINMDSSENNQSYVLNSSATCVECRVFIILKIRSRGSIKFDRKYCYSIQARRYSDACVRLIIESVFCSRDKSKTQIGRTFSCIKTNLEVQDFAVVASSYEIKHARVTENRIHRKNQQHNNEQR